MSDFTAIGSALYAACDNSSTVPVYYGLAPQGSACPYIIINRQAAIDTYDFSNRGLSADYQVKVISDHAWPTEAATLYDALHTGIQGTALTITGYSALRCERGSTIEYRDGGGFWHVGGLYRIDVYKT
jgi:hypothetical protein